MIENQKEILEYLNSCDGYYIVATKGNEHMSVLNGKGDMLDIVATVNNAMLGSIDKVMNNGEGTGFVLMTLIHESNKRWPKLKGVK